MELFERLYGNEKLKNTVARDILSGRQSHAYIFEGPEGSGKHTAAHLTAAALFCKSRDGKSFPCGTCPSCRKVFEGVCTDVITVGRGDKATVGVSAVRDGIKATLYFAPTEMNCKVYVIEDADKMTVQAQNALLLSLEEPPEFAAFILLCENSLLLLDTVKSRAPVIQMEVFDKEEIKSYVLSHTEYKKLAADEGALNTAVSNAGGSIGKALSFLKKSDPADEKLRTSASEAVSALLASSAAAKLEAASLFPQKRGDVMKMLAYIKTALRDILYYKKTKGAELLFYTDSEVVKKLCPKVSIARLSELYDRVTSAEGDIGANVSINAVLTLLLT
ncbi:MAG: hypothetical protein E7660_01285 [Ruminococcaceae bacterium]|nr:hypothetical protein [Oscillospiraceae bacterium]